jgi:superfamily I DNA/RNA helicase
MANRLGGDPSPELFNEIYPSVFEEAAVETALAPFDCLVIDEAQDLLRLRFLDALDLVLKGGLARGSWHLFLDPNQAIFSGAVEDGALERLADYGRAQFSLTVNCRNTAEIATHSAIVSQMDVPWEGTVQGGIARLEFIPVEPAQRELTLSSALKAVLQSGIKEEDVIVLSPRTLESSGLEGCHPAGRRLRDLTRREDGENGGARGARSVDFATMQAFKGLERRAVIAFGLDDLEDASMRLLHYCGLTRARTWLTVLVNESQQPAYERIAADFGRKLAALG